jgi:SAM-dependent methyltransferase
VTLPASVIVPFDAATASTAISFAHRLEGRVQQILLCGVGASARTSNRVEYVVPDAPGKGNAIRTALAKVTQPITIVQHPDAAYSPDAYTDLVHPIREDVADAVFGRRVTAGASMRAWPERAVTRLTNLVTELEVKDPLTGLKAFRTEALRSVTLSALDDEIDAEIVVKLAAQLFRLTEVPIQVAALSRDSVRGLWRKAQTLVRYATVQNDTDNTHEGYNTLARMDSANNYNAWLARKIQPQLGARVLEVGAGIGTITKEIEAGRELLIALEVDRFYVERLKNLFRGKPHVRPYLSDVAIADWKSLRKERLDSVVLSNVLEHIPDDAAAVRRFAQVLPKDGRLVIIVPALQELFGSIDEAVGHHRRYSAQTLRTVLEQNGFAVEKLEWMNVVGIPGWFVNGRIFKRRSVPPLQLRLYDRVAPLLAEAESHFKLPVGMSLFAVARATGESP